MYDYIYNYFQQIKFKYTGITTCIGECYLVRIWNKITDLVR